MNQKSYRLSGVRLPEKNKPYFDLHTIPKTPYIIPPVASKVDIAEAPLRNHWYRAVDELHEAKSWIIWGYSFPQTDTIAQVLFRTALSKNRKKKRVVVINPDPAVVQRVVEVCRKVEVDYYPSMERFLIQQKQIALD